jgi:hypothetical protein
MAGKMFRAILSTADATDPAEVVLYENGGLGGNTIDVGPDDEIKITDVEMACVADCLYAEIMFTKSPGVELDSIGVTAVASAGAGFSDFTRASGSFITDGFTVGESILTFGFSTGANNGTWVISAVSATELTVIDGADAMVNETGDAGNFLNPKALSDDWRTITAGSTTLVAAFFNASTSTPKIGPKGHSIYAKTPIAGQIDVVVMGEILQR